MTDYKFKCSGLSDDEYKVARNLFEQYRENYHIESFSDLRLLEELVYRETRQEYFKNQKQLYANTQSAKNKKKLFNLFDDAMNNNLEQIFKLKKKLKLYRDEQSGEDPMRPMKILLKKFEIWKSQNQAACTRVCPHCSRMLMFVIKPEVWEQEKYAYFKDKLLYIEPMWKLWRDNKITKEDLAKILGLTTNYIDWIDQHVEKKQ